MYFILKEIYNILYNGILINKLFLFLLLVKILIYDKLFYIYLVDINK